MRAFVINLDVAEDRWSFVQNAFARTKLELCRVPAVDGMRLQAPIKDYAEADYRHFHGRSTNPREVGCYLSHVRAWEAFLETGDAHGLICEDDLSFGADLEATLRHAIAFSAHWNVLRVTGLSTGKPVAVAPLGGRYSLCVNFAQVKGAAAYVLDRAAAKAFVRHLVPMRLPLDHAIDREWFYGLKAACVLPFPVSQTASGFRTSIQRGGARRLPSFRRWLTTYPYQAHNETSRWASRTWAYMVARGALFRTNAQPAEAAVAG